MSGACTKCNRPNADQLSITGDLVCRSCASTIEADARLEAGKAQGTFGAKVGIAFGVLMAVGGVLIAAALGGRGGARIGALLAALGVSVIAVCVRNLRILATRPR